jgi:hypothetical protein
MMLAALMREPSLVLTEEESAKLAAAVNRVVELYDVPLLDERSRAWIGLSLVGVEVYGTRIASAVVNARQRPRAVVTPIKATPPPPPPRPEGYAHAGTNPQTMDPTSFYTEGTVIHGQA